MDQPLNDLCANESLDRADAAQKLFEDSRSDPSIGRPAQPEPFYPRPLPFPLPQPHPKPPRPFNPDEFFNDDLFKDRDFSKDSIEKFLDLLLNQEEKKEKLPAKDRIAEPQKNPEVESSEKSER